jgi:hypothetical protein
MVCTVVLFKTALVGGNGEVISRVYVRGVARSIAEGDAGTAMMRGVVVREAA